MLLFLPVGVALSCLETAVTAGLIVIDGEVYPGRGGGGSLAEMERVNFRPWISHLSEQQYTVIQRMCDPIGAMTSTVHVIYRLCVHSDKIAANALER
jgi:hypothetical protein